MISFDTNILFAALESSARGHSQARDLLIEYEGNERVALCELVLLELYCLLRNSAVVRKPLPAESAVAVIQELRHHRRWRVIDYAAEVADKVWVHSSKPGFAFRRIYDVRIALTLRHHGVTDFVTGNTADFQGFGFRRLWDPLQ
jgi:toxin-antitoxin system PIN domain toxin